MLRVVLDTNFLVSALLTPRGASAAILAASDRYLLCLSHDILAELEDVLSRPRIRRRYPLTDDDVAQYVSLLADQALLVMPNDPQTGASRDPGDDIIFACAVAAHADCVVSRDPHVLDVQKFPLLITTPERFLAWLRTSR